MAGEVDLLRSDLVLLERSTVDTLRNENEVTPSHTHIHTHTHDDDSSSLSDAGTQSTDQETGRTSEGNVIRYMHAAECDALCSWLYVM